MADQPTPPPVAPSASPSVPRTAPIAIWSPVLAILFFTGGWLFTAIPAVICGHIARSKIRKSGGALRGIRIATAGLIVGMIKSDRERIQRLSIEKKEIAADDGKLKVTVSGIWTKVPELNKEARLQVGYKSKEMYLIVISDAKSAVGNITLEQHQQLTRDRMLQKMKNASATQPVPLNIDGHPALQDEVREAPGRTEIVFLHTTVDDGDHFQQILAWTLKSRWQEQNEQLREITNSFHSE